MVPALLPRHPTPRAHRPRRVRRCGTADRLVGRDQYRRQLRPLAHHLLGAALGDAELDPHLRPVRAGAAGRSRCADACAPRRRTFRDVLRLLPRLAAAGEPGAAGAYDAHAAAARQCLRHMEPARALAHRPARGEIHRHAFMDRARARGRGVGDGRLPARFCRSSRRRTTSASPSARPCRRTARWKAAPAATASKAARPTAPSR